MWPSSSHNNHLIKVRHFAEVMSDLFCVVECLSCHQINIKVFCRIQHLLNASKSNENRKKCRPSSLHDEVGWRYSGASRHRDQPESWQQRRMERLPGSSSERPPQTPWPPGCREQTTQCQSPPASQWVLKPSSASFVSTSPAHVRSSPAASLLQPQRHQHR